MQKENAIVDECLYALAHFGFYVIPRGKVSVWPDIDPTKYVGVVWRQNTGGVKIGRSFVRFGIPGLPDLMGWHFPTGVRVAIEVKTAEGVMNPNQKKHMDLAQATGCIAFVARSYQDVERELKSRGFQRK